MQRNLGRQYVVSNRSDKSVMGLATNNKLGSPVVVVMQTNEYSDLSFGDIIEYATNETRNSFWEVVEQETVVKITQAR